MAAAKSSEVKEPESEVKKNKKTSQKKEKEAAVEPKQEDDAAATKKPRGRQAGKNTKETETPAAEEAETPKATPPKKEGNHERFKENAAYL